MTTIVKLIVAPMPDHSVWVRSRNAITYQAESMGGSVTVDEGPQIVIAVEFQDPIKAGEFASWWERLVGVEN
jgi:uncharacterized protein YmfQ (DUF2313 family)